MSFYRPMLMLFSILALTACSSGSSGGSGGPASSSTPGSTVAASLPAALTSPTPSAPVWKHPNAGNAVPTSTAATPASNSGNGSATIPSNANNSPSTNSGNNGATAGSNSTNAGSASTSSASSGSTTTVNGTTPSATNPSPSPSTGPQLFGSIPPDPETGFSGQLYFVGEKLQPGSQILVTFQGLPIKTLSTNFLSSELLSAYVFLTIPGDYRFEAVAPDGSISGGFDLQIPQGTLPGVFANVDPAIQMTFPTQFQQGFLGSIYIMGDHFAPGAQLLVQTPNLPAFTAPLTYINSRTLAWTIAAPLPGSVNVRVVNPDLRSSTPITLTFGPSPVLQTGTFPRPSVAFGPSLLTAPFVGSSHIYGQDFLPGALIEWKDLSTNQVTLVPAGYVSNQELIWTVAYPAPGQYELVVVNPDNQRSTPLTVDVQ